MLSLMLLLIGLLLLPFSSPFQFQYRCPSFERLHRIKIASTCSDELLDLVRSESKEMQASRIETVINDLESTYETPKDDDQDRFQKLIGLYDVSYVKSIQAGDNPVGGKWTRKSGIAQRILRTRRTLQHILPVNTTGIGATVSKNGETVVGEAVNVISLEALWGIVRLTVVLRGDAVPLTMQERTNTTRVVQPLSSQAVKALFDSPRIILGKTGRILNINIGPNSLVLLDTKYCDEKVRIGMGGTSGTRFVFGRCPDGDDEAEEYMKLLQMKPTKKVNALLVLGAIASTGAYGAVAKGAKVTGGILCLVSVLFGSLIATASGGIESNDRGVKFRKEENSIGNLSA